MFINRISNELDLIRMKLNFGNNFVVQMLFNSFTIFEAGLSESNI